MRLLKLFAIPSVIALTAVSANAETDYTKISPAVSAINGSFDVFGGSNNGDELGGVSAILTLPVDDNVGFQIDTLFTQNGSNDGGGIGAHYFYRNPESFLLGATSMWYKVEGFEIRRHGVESEFYLGDFTIAASGGIQVGDATVDKVGFATADLSYYLNESLKLTIGTAGYEGSDKTGYVGVDWQADKNSPFTFFANLGKTETQEGFAIAGIRFSFGSEGQSLQHRDRYSDPKNIVTGVDTQAGSTIVKDANTRPAQPVSMHYSCSSFSSNSLSSKC